MKKYRGLLLLIAVIVIISGCTTSKPTEGSSEDIKPVKVTRVEEETKENTIQYTGNVNVKDTKTFAFKSPGKISQVLVEKGQEIKKGQVLAKLDTTDLNFALEAARGKVDAANSQYQKAVNGATQEDIQQLKINVQKAQDAFQYTEDLYKKMKELYDAGGISKNDLDKLELEQNMRSSELNQAKVALQTAVNGTRPEDIAMARANLSMAQTDLSYKESQIQDGTITSDMDGFVAEIIQKEGSFVSAGYPVIALRGDSQVVKTGIARQDIDKVHLGTKVYIQEEELSYTGKISYISDIPDPYTRTYEAEITLDEGSLSLGSIVELQIVTGSEKGIWIPVSAMMSDGKDYVLVAKKQTGQGKESSENSPEEFRVERKDITITSTKGALAKVEGLVPEDKLIIEGMRSVKEKDPVKLIGE